MTFSEPPVDAPTPSGPVFDVTDATFQELVVDRSKTTAVVVDLWAPWCGPCLQLGPILESVVTATEGQVVLAKVNVDENPQISQAFGVQSIPAVHALFGGRVVDSFIGARGEADVRSFVDALRPTEEQLLVSKLLDAGDEASLGEVLELEPANESAILGLAEIYAVDGRRDEALRMLDRVPDTTEARRIAALARAGADAVDHGDVEARLDGLLDRVKDDPEARQEFLDVLELMGPDDPRTATYRKALTTRLY